MYNIHLLPALFGDAILIEYGQPKSPKYILIDGGPFYGYEEMINGLKRVAPKLTSLELLIVTHIDIDHIDGTIRLLNQSPLPLTIKDIWFNGLNQLKQKNISGDQLGAIQGEYLSHLINKHQLNHNREFAGKAVVVEDTNALPIIQLPGGFQITLLAPSVNALKKLLINWKKEIDKIGGEKEILNRWAKETRYGRIPQDMLGGKDDTSPANASSIAFIGSYEGKSCLFAGDTPTAELLPAIQQLKKERKQQRLLLDAWKLAHHGSKRSTSTELITQVTATNILISTNGNIHHLPDEECIKNVLSGHDGCHLYFNYRSEYNQKWDDRQIQKTSNYTAHFPEKEPGITISLST